MAVINYCQQRAQFLIRRIVASLSLVDWKQTAEGIGFAIALATLMAWLMHLEAAV